MIMSGQTIRRQKIFTPFHERTTHRGMSFGLGPAGYDVRVQQALILEPGNFALVSTIEHFTVPNNALGMVADKSTWARRGMAVQNTIIEPGWAGYLTLELSNHGTESLEIYAGDPIAQIIFHLTDEPVESPYSGKYQFQAPTPVGAILEEGR